MENIQKQLINNYEILAKWDSAELFDLVGKIVELEIALEKESNQ